MISLQDYNKSKDVKSLVNKFFEVRQVSHNVHLQTKSYSTHKALNSYYDDLLDLVDEFIETYQGQYGILSGYEKIDVSQVSDIEGYLENSVKIFSAARENIKDAHLQNILDEIVALTYRTLYKLKNLK
jgi:hypothetical protein